uniref:Uncharacterized protein n=1 Tax=Bracon brevicornis TaxID=1563983 RepID=A0A6V7HNE4_9HYME
MAEYQLDFTPLSLQELTLIEVAKLIWMKPSLKKALITHVPVDKKRNGKNSKIRQSTVRWTVRRDVIEVLACQFKVVIAGLEIPEVLKGDLIDITRKVGFTIIEWLEMLKKKENPLTDLETYYDHMKWSNYGISTAATLRSLYFSKNLPVTSNTFSELAYYCLEDCIVDMFEYADQDFLHGITPDRLKQSPYVTHWLHRLVGKPIIPDFPEEHPYGQVVQCVNKYVTDLSFMFILSVTQFNHTAAKYYWTIMDDHAKHLAVNKLAFSRGTMSPIDEAEQIHIELIMFVWNIFCTYNIHYYVCCDSRLLLNHPAIIMRVIHWPWLEVIMKTLVRIIKTIPLLYNQRTLDQILLYLTFSAKIPTRSKWIDLVFIFWHYCPSDIKASLRYDLLVDFLMSHGGRHFKPGAQLLTLVKNDGAFSTSKMDNAFLDSVIDYGEANDHFRDDFSIKKYFGQLNLTEEERVWITKRRYVALCTAIHCNLETDSDDLKNTDAIIKMTE